MKRRIPISLQIGGMFIITISVLCSVMGYAVYAIEESAKGTQEMVNNAQTISAVAQETSANTQTVAAALEEQNASMHEINTNAEALAKMAEELNAIVRSFKVK